MKSISYFFQFCIIKILFIIFKILRYKKASRLGNVIGKKLGPIFKSKKTIKKNLSYIIPDLKPEDESKIIEEMWGNYGKILAEYMFIKDFRNDKLKKHIEIVGLEYLYDIKKKNQPVVFVSGHFNNFELMAMEIEKTGVKLGAIYRPLNNFFLNKTMEKIRKNYICKIQIKKGLSGLREILNLFKKNISIALMIDQRVTEGVKVNLFNKPAFTTSIPAQLVKKFNCPILTLYIERVNEVNFKIIINKPIYFDKNQSSNDITKNLNKWIEKMILKNPEQWILTHNRWKL